MLGKYKHGKPNKEIDVVDLKLAIDTQHLKLRHEAYAVLLYWVGCRRCEPLEILKEHVIENDGILEIVIPAKKSGERGGSLDLSLSYYGVEKIREVWIKTKKGRPLFPFSAKTGYRIVKKLFPKKTPHWFRHNRVTKLRKKLGNELTIDEIKSFTGIRRDTTIQNYGMKTKAGIHKVSQHLE